MIAFLTGVHSTRNTPVSQATMTDKDRTEQRHCHPYQFCSITSPVFLRTWSTFVKWKNSDEIPSFIFFSFLFWQKWLAADKFKMLCILWACFIAEIWRKASLSMKHQLQYAILIDLLHVAPLFSISTSIILVMFRFISFRYKTYETFLGWVE